MLDYVFKILKKHNTVALPYHFVNEFGIKYTIDIMDRNGFNIKIRAVPKWNTPDDKIEDNEAYGVLYIAELI